MSQIIVKAAPNVRVPIEGKPKSYIESDESITVAHTAYYERRIADGDLIVLDKPLKKKEVATDGE